MINSSSIRFNLLEVNYLQVSILTIKVFLTYLTYFNQNYFLHSNKLCTSDSIYIHITYITTQQSFPLYKKLHHNTIQTIPLHILFHCNQIYFPNSNILSTQYIIIQVHTLNTTYQIIYLNTLSVWVYIHIPILLPLAISPCSKNYITTQFKQLHYTYLFNHIQIISLTQIYFPFNIFQQHSIH